jgi:hypothetical protein
MAVMFLSLTKSQVYVTILASLPASPADLRSSVNRNLTDMVELHVEILEELHSALALSEYSSPDLSTQQTITDSSICTHRRWRSLDTVREDRNPSLCSWDIPDAGAEPQTAAEVARVFLKRVSGNVPCLSQRTVLWILLTASTEL